MSIEWHLETRRIDELVEYYKNPRRISKDQYCQLKASIDKFGLIDKPIINTNGTIIAGHQRIRLLRFAQVEDTDVWVPNRTLTNEEVEELNYRHNENHGSWDWDILANQYDMGDLENWGTMSLVEDEEEKPKKPTKCKATFEFATKAELDAFAKEIEEAALTWGAKLKVKA